eukprot:9924233-Alexandrium_andersonii.AAC.1
MVGTARAMWSLVGADVGFIALCGWCSAVGRPVAVGRHGCQRRANLALLHSRPAGHAASRTLGQD